MSKGISLAKNVSFLRKYREILLILHVFYSSIMFTTTLLEWFAINRRDLPWRHTRDPYAIWLSEIILQQTRIQQGEDYWLRFMRRWPTVEELADATEDEVLREWQGLGYYSRARNLLTAARQIVERGSFPDTLEELRKLKGVGDYTAAAIGIVCSQGISALIHLSTRQRGRNYLPNWHNHCCQPTNLRHTIRQLWTLELYNVHPRRPNAFAVHCRRVVRLFAWDEFQNCP